MTEPTVGAVFGPDELAAVEALDAAASIGLWTAGEDGLVWADRPGDPVSGSSEVEDAVAIAALHNALPRLTEALRSAWAERDQAHAELARITNLARANEEAHRAEIRQILSPTSNPNVVTVIPVLGDVEMCEEHGCARWMCECFPATKGEDRGAV